MLGYGVPSEKAFGVTMVETSSPSAVSATDSNAQFDVQRDPKPAFGLVAKMAGTIHREVRWAMIDALNLHE